MFYLFYLYTMAHMTSMLLLLLLMIMLVMMMMMMAQNNAIDILTKCDELRKQFMPMRWEVRRGYV